MDEITFRRFVNALLMANAEGKISAADVVQALWEQTDDNCEHGVPKEGRHACAQCLGEEAEYHNYGEDR